MTEEAMTTESFGEQAGGSGPVRQGIDRSAGAGRGGSIVFVLLVAGILIGAATGVVLLGGNGSESYILLFLGVLATIGVFSLFAMATGILRTSASQAGNPLVKTVLDGAFDGVVVTDADGRVIYANTAYLDLIGATGPHDARPVERV